MGLEVATYVSEFEPLNPVQSDGVNEGDNHLRLIKSVLQTTFPTFNRAFYHDTVETIVGSDTLVATDDRRTISFDATAGARTAALPDTPANGYEVTISKSDSSANTVTVNRSGTNTINGATSYVLRTQYQSVKFKHIGAGLWITLSEFSSDLAAIAQITGTGLLTRTGTGTYAVRTITGTANQVNVANGDGVAGNPTLSLPSDLANIVTAWTVDGSGNVSGVGTITSGIHTITGTDPYLALIDTDTNVDSIVSANSTTGSISYIADLNAEAANSTHLWYIDDGTTVRLRLTTTALDPGVSGSKTLGTATVPWSTIHLAAASGLNWANGGITVTEASDSLSFQLAQSYLFDNQGVFTAAVAALHAVNNANSASVQVATFQGDRSAPANSDLAYISLILSDSVGTQTEFGRILWQASDVTNGSEDGILHFAVMTAGTIATELSLVGTGLYPFNPDGLSLGIPGNGFSDLYLEVGAVINYAGGTELITHAANTLTFSGFSSGIVFDQTGATNVAIGFFVNNGTGLRWQHSNTNFSGSLGTLSGGGSPFVGFHAFHSATANTLQNDGAGVRGMYMQWNGITFDMIINGVATANTNFSSTVTALSFTNAGAGTVVNTFSHVSGADGTTHFNGFTGGNGRWTIGTHASGHTLIATQNSLDLRLGVGTADDIIISTTAITLGLPITSIDLGNADTTLARAAAGEVSVEGTVLKKVGKETIWIPAGAMISRTTNGAAAGTTELATNDVMMVTFDFDQTTEEGVGFWILMPKSWNESTVTFRPVWTAASGSGGVVWGVAAFAFSDDDALDQAVSGQQTSTDTFIAANDCHLGPESAAITIGGTPAEMDMVYFEVTREVANGSDTLNADAKLLGIHVYITTNASTDA